MPIRRLWGAVHFQRDLVVSRRAFQVSIARRIITKRLSQDYEDTRVGSLEPVRRLIG